MRGISCVAMFFLVASLLLSGCANMTGRQKAFWEGAAGGAMIGIGAGGVVGQEDDSDHAPAGMAIGALVGGILGGFTGLMTYKEPSPPPPKPVVRTPEPEPKPVPESAPVFAPKPQPVQPVVRERIVLHGINFDFDKSAIKPEFEPVLDEAAVILKRRNDVKVVIEGHTCWIGTEAYNQALSERRAKSARDYLKSKRVSIDQLTMVGYGETRPTADNRTREGRRMNRRVEFKVME